MNTTSVHQALSRFRFGPRRSATALLCLAALFSACKSDTPAAPSAVSGVEPAAKAALERATGAAMTLAKTLRARLQAELPKGVGSAITVCANEAPTIAAKLATDAKVRVGRASLKLRNPNNTAPAWVDAWLRAQGTAKAAAAQGFARVERGPDGRDVARVLRPIAVEPVCLTCHGPREQLAPGLKQQLAARYPTDAAVDYAAGDLRGALWAEVDL